MTPEQQIIALVAEQTGTDRAEIDRSTTFDDLGTDSLDLVEIIVEAEDRLEVSIPDEQAAALRTVGDLVDLVERNPHAEPGPRATAEPLPDLGRGGGSIRRWLLRSVVRLLAR